MIVLAVAPVVLLHFFGGPLPDRLPERDDVQRWIYNPLTEGALVGLVEYTLWAAWAVLAITAVIAVIRQITRLLVWIRRHPTWQLRLQPPPNPRRPGAPIQIVAGGVAGAVAAALPAAAVAAAPTASSAPAPSTGSTALSNADVAHVNGTVAATAPAAQGPPQFPSAPARAHPTPTLAPDSPTPDAPMPSGSTPNTPASGWWLPDGSWITLPTALALVAVWRTVAAATDSLATPTTMAALLRRATRPRSSGRTPPAATGSGRNREPAPDPREAATQMAVTGPSVTGLAALGSAVLLPAGGVGLTGPAAAEAARGLLVTTLLTQPGVARVLTTAADWELLAAATLPPPEVVVMTDLAAALADLEQHILAETDRALPTGSTRRPPLLIAAVPSPPHAGRLAIALRHGHPYGAGAILIGPWPYATTWHVDNAGRITPALDTARDQNPSQNARSAGSSEPRNQNLPPNPPSTTPSATATATATVTAVIAPSHRAAAAADRTTTGGQWRSTVLTVAACADILSTLQASTREPPSPSTRTADSPADPPHATAAFRDRETSGEMASAAPEAWAPAPQRLLRRRSPDGGTQRRRIVQPLLLRVLGAERLTTAAGAPLKLPRKASMDILVLLAVHPEGLHRDSILEAVWPDVRHNAAVSRLHTTLSSLRSAAAAITATPIVVRTGTRYQLNPAAINVDLWQLHHHAAAARRSTPDQKAEHWRAVIGLATSASSDHPIPDSPAFPVTDSSAQAPTRPVEGPGTDPTINRSGRPTTGHPSTLATGMTWPWLHPHRRSLHNTVAEALSHLRGQASAINRPGSRTVPRSVTRSTPGSPRPRTVHDTQP
ncbi:hypothetical protein [Virgisporangium aurantiacum]|uniref:hypothetical protein n=1 Tax=Virgisporangium aurantiacum TaxID=175570 RepID=UPI00194EAAF7|nr:hypothetical protein [Virgisporangium aurantiacum]